MGAAVASLLTAAAAAVATLGGSVTFDAADDHDYRWVDPPAIHAPHNVAPEGRRAEAAPGIETFWTPDMQVQLRWGERRRPMPVTVDVQPLSPGTLPALPSGARPAGNAYRIELAPPSVLGDVVLHLRVPTDVDRVYVAGRDGREWRSVAFAPEEPGIVTVPWDGDGTVLAATATDAPSVWPVVAGAAGAMCSIVAVAVWLRRREGRSR